MMSKSLRLGAVLATLLATSHAFYNSKTTFAARRVNGEPTTTQVGLFDFLNEGKKALVKSFAGEYDAAAIRARINQLVQQNDVLMLSFTTWPFCIQAKEVLDGKSAKYTAVELDKDPDGKAIRAELGDMVGRTSVPAIWIGGTFVGGCNDGPLGGIVKLDQQGKLDGMLQSVGAKKTRGDDDSFDWEMKREWEC